MTAKIASNSRCADHNGSYLQGRIPRDDLTARQGNDLDPNIRNITFNIPRAAAMIAKLITGFIPSPTIVPCDISTAPPHTTRGLRMTSTKNSTPSS